MTTVAASMIVRNEAEIITRALSSLLGVVDVVCVVDTGSTDDTVDVIRSWAEDTGTDVVIEDRPWVGFDDARNAALDLARRHADWALVLDADETWSGDLSAADLSDVGVWEIDVYNGAMRYSAPLLIHRDVEAVWRFPTHEYLEHSSSPALLSSGRIVHHADGGTRVEKWDRDAALLTPLADAGDSRAVFYLGVTEHGRGNLAAAAARFAQRAEMPGWSEERYVARMWQGDCYAQMQDMARATWCWLSAANYLPQRPDAWSRLAAVWGGPVGALMSGPARQSGEGYKLFVEREDAA
jgi:Glycosyl transferase family 2